jgi:hypothetical protein
MSRSSLVPIRQDLHDFFNHCECLLAGVQAPDHALFSPYELMMICYYANEIAKIADSQRLAEPSNGKPVMRSDHNASAGDSGS